MDEPQAEQLVETLDHCGAPRAAGGADTSQAWYQLRARKRDTFADTSRTTLSCTGGERGPPRADVKRGERRRQLFARHSKLTRLPMNAVSW